LRECAGRIGFASGDALVLVKIGDLQQFNTIDGVSDDEMMLRERLDERGNVCARFVWQEFCTDSGGAVFESAGAVGHAQEADEEQPSERVERGHLVIHKEGGFDGADSHSRPSFHDFQLIGHGQLVGMFTMKENSRDPGRGSFLLALFRHAILNLRLWIEKSPPNRIGMM